MTIILHPRKILSFVRREGRLTNSQERALSLLYPLYGISLETTPELTSLSLFNNQNPLILEIGFGMGQSLITMALENPDQNYLGIEVHRPGVGHILLGIEKENLKNLKILCHDAVEIINQNIPNQALTGVQIFFPDPWHKKKHNKRRLVQENFIKNLIPKLRSNTNSNSWIHLATDWEDYANQMMSVMTSLPEFKNKFGENKFSPDTANRPSTKFQARGEKSGHGVWDLIFEKIA